MKTEKQTNKHADKYEDPDPKHKPMTRDTKPENRNSKKRPETRTPSLWITSATDGCTYPLFSTPSSDIFSHSAAQRNQITRNITSPSRKSHLAVFKSNSLYFPSFSRQVIVKNAQVIPILRKVNPLSLAGPAQKRRASQSSSSSSLSNLDLSDTKVYQPSIRDLGNSSHFCEVVVLKSRTVSHDTTLSLEILRLNISATLPHNSVNPQSRHSAAKSIALSQSQHPSLLNLLSLGKSLCQLS
jgi:hypothetical protein